MAGVQTGADLENPVNALNRSCFKVAESPERQKLADVAELVDALVSGTSGSNVVGVQVSPSALS